MSHSQFRRFKTYTETCMDESLRQAYDYWQDQPGYMVAESVRPKPTESYREDYKICSRCNFKIASQHFFANPQNDSRFDDFHSEE